MKESEKTIPKMDNNIANIFGKVDMRCFLANLTNAQAGETVYCDSGVENSNDSNQTSAMQNNEYYSESPKHLVPPRFLERRNAKESCFRRWMIAENMKKPCAIEEIDHPGSSLSLDVTDTSCTPRELPRLSVNIAGSFHDLNQNQYGMFPGVPTGLLGPPVRVKGLKMYKPCSRNPRINDIYSKLGRLDRKMPFAATVNNIEMTKRLLEAGAAPNCFNGHGQQPIHIACRNGCPDTLRLLLQYGADVNGYDKSRRTPLHYAVETASLSTVELSLAANANPFLPDGVGLNALQRAEKKLRSLESYQGETVVKTRAELNDIVKKIRETTNNDPHGVGQQVEALSSVCSRLSIANTGDQGRDERQNRRVGIDETIFMN